MGLLKSVTGIFEKIIFDPFLRTLRQKMTNFVDFRTFWELWRLIAAKKMKISKIPASLFEKSLLPMPIPKFRVQY